MGFSPVFPCVSWNREKFSGAPQHGPEANKSCGEKWDVFVAVFRTFFLNYSMKLGFVHFFLHFSMKLAGCIDMLYLYIYIYRSSSSYCPDSFATINLKECVHSSGLFLSFQSTNFGIYRR